METGPAGQPTVEPTDTVLSAIETAGIVPVVVLDDASAANPLADALLESGLYCVEIALRTPAALPALRVLSNRTGLTVGAGTVLDAEQVDRCVDSGARFAVSPGFDDAVVERCQTVDLLILPGTATASEVLRARRRGLSSVKFFPAESSGGLPAIEALAAAIHGIRFMPTGGIGPGDAGRYLRSKAVLAVGGSWVVEEMQLLLGTDDRRPAEALAKALADLGPAEAVIKHGARGCTAMIDGELFELPALVVPVVDMVGAGDAFAAGYIAERLADLPAWRRLETAIAAGALAVSVPGDCEGLPRRTDLDCIAARQDVAR